MLAQIPVIIALTATFVAAIAIPAADSTLDTRALPHCRQDGMPNSCSTGSSCVFKEHGTCQWWYCQGGNLEKWIDCGNRGCTYRNGQPACN